MPKITRWFIKAGMIYLMLGMILAFIAELPAINRGALLLPVYWHMLVIGWITQVIMGVSIWMFPRKKKDRHKTETVPAILAFWLLNSGLILRFISEPFIPLVKGDLFITVAIAISSLFQMAAIIFYVVEIWPRIQPKKKKVNNKT